MRKMGEKCKAVTQTPTELWVSGYDDLDQYLSVCKGEDHVWDLAERISDDARASGCVIAVEDVFEELVLRWRSELGANKEFCRNCTFYKISEFYQK